KRWRQFVITVVIPAQHTERDGLVRGGSGTTVEFAIHHAQQHAAVEMLEQTDIQLIGGGKEIGGQRVGIERIFLHVGDIQPYTAVPCDDPIAQRQVAGSLVVHI